MRRRQKSQCALILARLQAQPGEGWVSMPELVAASGSFNVHSRVDELRHAHGLPIENRTDLTTRPHRSEYRLPRPVAGLKLP